MYIVVTANEILHISDIPVNYLKKKKRLFCLILYSISAGISEACSDIPGSDFEAGIDLFLFYFYLCILKTGKTNTKNVASVI